MDALKPGRCFSIGSRCPSSEQLPLVPHDMPGVNHSLSLAGRLRRLCAWWYVCVWVRVCVSVRLHFCIWCHISCLSPTLLSRLPGPVSLMGFVWRVWWGIWRVCVCEGGYPWSDKCLMSGSDCWCRLGYMVGPQKNISGWFLERNILSSTCTKCPLDSHKCTPFTSTQKTIIFFALNQTFESCIVHLSVCVLYSPTAYVCGCIPVCGSVLFHPTLVAM